MKSTSNSSLGRARTHGLVLGALTLPLAAAPQSEPKVPAYRPAVDPDQAKTLWVAPAKDGRFATDHSHLPLAERIALDAALNRGEGRPGAAARASNAGKLAGAPETPTFSAARDPRSHFQIDAPGDGRLWVYGGTYKASFGPEGATYIPAFGSAAPQNFPVTFRLDAVTSSGEALAFDGAAAPTLAGQRVTFERGACAERYDVAHGRVEQSFVFHTLPGAGELVVELDVESALEASETAHGLTFAGALGRVDYSRAVAIDAAGRRLDLATTLVDGEVHLTVPAAFVASAALPLVIDPVLTTWVVNNGASDDFSADIAYDADNNRFLVVYERAFSATDHDVWGELFDPSTGAPIANSGAYIDFTGAYWETPRCANNRLASQFLVVATRRGSPDEVWARTREAENTTQGAQFQVSSGSGAKSNPDVGGDPELAAPTYYCVVWERAFNPFVDHDVHAQLVRSTSVLQGPLVLIDNSGGTFDKWPTISKHDGLAPYGTQAWNITWARQFNANDWDIRGAQVRWDGAIQTPSFELDSTVTDHRYPEVSTSLEPTAYGRPYLVVYEQWLPNTVEIVAALMSGPTYITALNLSVAMATPPGLSDILPAVDTDGSHFAVTWSQQYQLGSGDFDMYVCGLYNSGSLLYVSDPKTNLAFSSTYEGNGRIASLYGSGFTSTWLGAVWTDSAGVGNVEAATYELPVGYGTRIGARYCPANPNSTGVAGSIGAEGVGYAGGQALHLSAYQLPQNVFCYFLGSPVPASTTTPATSGIVCVGNPLSRFNGPGQVGNTGAAGRVDLDVDTLAIPLPSGGTLALASGTTFHFQAWYRDGATNNLTDAVAVLFR